MCTSHCATTTGPRGWRTATATRSSVGSSPRRCWIGSTVEALREWMGMTLGAKDGRRRFPGRWPVLAGAVAIVLAVAIAWGWFSWLPSYRPSLREGERYGIDVSNHQGRIEWDRVVKDDISFAYIKATEGGDFVDSRFSENWTDAMAAG